MMKELIQKIRRFFSQNKKSSHKMKRKSKAQSMVEFALLLPILLILFSGMVEFGFMLNSYLSILDATRQAARFYSNSTPFTLNSSNVVVDDMTFYPAVATEAVKFLAPDDPEARQIPFDMTRDNVLVSVVSVSVNTAPDPDVISSIARYPSGFSFYTYGKVNGAVSVYTDAKIQEFMTKGGSVPVEAGLLIVEISYSYEGVLKLPWVAAFASDANPLMLYASTVMPLVSVRP